MSFANLKRNSGNFAALRDKMKEEQSKGNYNDDRFWKLSVDKNGTGSAVIRFMPPLEGEPMPYVLVYHHAFKNPKSGKWFIENCPTSLGVGTECPVCQSNSKAWDSGVEANKKIASARKRQKQYITNIYVVDDPSNKDNNGKVFLFKFGQKILEMIMGQIDPQFADETPCNVFDFWEGANFQLRAYNNTDGMRSYDKSKFLTPGPLADDSKLEQIYGQLYKLQPFVSPENYKTYDELSKRFALVTGEGGYQAPEQQQASKPELPAGPDVDADWDEGDDDLPWSASEPKKEDTPKPEVKPEPSADSSAASDALASYEAWLNQQ